MADAADVAEASREEPAREDPGRMLREDREHGPEKEPDKRNRDRVLDERGHDPDGHFESREGCEEQDRVGQGGSGAY